MAVLGRIDDKKDLLATARIIAEKKMSTGRVVAYLRRIRSGREDIPDSENLSGALETFCNSYLARHPATTKDMIIESLRELAESLEAL